MTDESRTSAWAVYAGPSLAQADRDKIQRSAGMRASILWRPSIRRGDLSANDTDTTNILIVDGEFGQNLAISVAEIREAIRSGYVIHGVSSMGALRAVECEVLGMVGHGWVFQQYKTKATESDADVALTFDPIDGSPITIPQINVVYLLREGPLANMDPAMRAKLEDSSREMYYIQRTPTNLLGRWLPLVGPAYSAAFRKLVGTPEGRLAWDRKRLDALEALSSIGALQ